MDQNGTLQPIRNRHGVAKGRITDVKVDVLYLDHYEQSAHVIDHQANRRELDALAQIRIRPVSFHRAVVGPDWGSGGGERTSHFHHIHFVVGGSAKIIHQGVVLTMTRGGVYWLPANCPVASSCDDRYDHFFLVLRLEWVNGMELFIRGRRPMRLGSWKAREYMSQWGRSPLPLSAYLRLQAFVQKLLAESLDDLDAIVTEQYAYQIDFAKVFRRIDAHTGEHVTIAELSRMQGVSAKAFSKRFRACFGVNPKKYLNVRINHQAVALVVGTDRSMSAIAEALGFRDAYYFNRFFSAMNGVSPFRYRKQSADRSHLRCLGKKVQE